MESMRTLNSGLPGTSPSKTTNPEPPEQLLQAFKAAALSVTKLYKTAALDQTRARAEGYQDALDELLAFLDKENLGLSDGEGWRVRRWATERLDGRDTVSQHAESDEERDNAERGSSPALHRQPNTTRRTPSPARQELPVASDPTPVMESVPAMLPPQGSFTFRSTQSYPQDTDINLSDLDLSDSARNPHIESSVVAHAPHNPSASITISRPNRSSSRHTGQNTRHHSRTAASTSRTAGQKRKLNLGEYFDLGNFGNGKDGFSGSGSGGGGGGKRGRFA